MSTITNLFLAVDYGDEVLKNEINRYFEGSYRPSGFLLASGSGASDDSLGVDTEHMWYGGSKMMEAILFAGAFNHLDIAALKEHLRSLNWKQPQFVQLFIKEQDDNVWFIEYLFPDMPRMERY